MTLPGQTAGVSVFFDPITADLGISRTWASSAYAAGTLAGILPAPIIGRWIDRRGPRLTATIIAASLVLACAYMALVQSGLMLLLGFALLRERPLEVSASSASKWSICGSCSGEELQRRRRASALRQGPWCFRS